MLAFLCVVMGQALCEDAAVCASEQLNLLQLRNGQTTNALRVNPDARDGGGQKDAPPKLIVRLHRQGHSAQTLGARLVALHSREKGRAPEACV